jgi:hypothetical protein
MKVHEKLQKEISDAMACLIEIQEQVAWHRVENINMITQEADKLIRGLRELENLLPDGTCTVCEGELDDNQRCDDPLCGRRNVAIFARV